MKLDFPEWQSKESLRSKNALADSRKQSHIYKDPANMDLSFQSGVVRQPQPFPLDKPFTSSVLQDKEYGHYLQFDSFTGVRLLILLCAANLFMTWHNGPAMSVTTVRMVDLPALN